MGTCWRTSVLIFFFCVGCFDLIQGAEETKTIAEYEEEAREVLAESQEKIDEANSKIRQHVFFGDPKEDLYIYEESGARRLQEEAYIDARNALKKMPFDQFEDEELKRQIRLSMDMEHYALEVLEFADFQNMTQIFKDTYYGPRRWLTKDSYTYSYVPDFLDMYKFSDSYIDMESTWVYWHNVIKNEIRGPLKLFIELYKTTAEKSNFDAADYYYVDYEGENMLTELTDVMEQLQPFYMQLHGYIRHHLIEYYNYTDSAQDSIPLHLFEQTLARAWDNNPAAPVPYPDNEMLNLIDATSTSTANELFDLAAKFYSDMNGDLELPSETFEDTIFFEPADNSSTEPEGHCKDKFHKDKEGFLAYVCPEVTFKHFMQLHRLVAEIHTGHERAFLPYIFKQDPCPGFDKAIGEAVILAASSFKRVNKNGIELEFVEEVAINRLYHSAVHTLMMIPLYYVYEKMTVDVFSHRVSLDEFNCVYWRYMSTYLGVRPPVQRTDNDIDITYRFFDGLSQGNTPTSKLVAEILGFQLYKGWCEKAEEINTSDMEHKLHNCDFSVSTDVGQSFVDIIKPGKKAVWRDLIEPVTGVRKLNAQAILDYYEPLIEWLTKYNEENDVLVGWVPNEMCGTPEQEKDLEIVVPGSPIFKNKPFKF